MSKDLLYATGSISEFAAAKINLSLRVGDLRNDGYHPIDSLVAFADFGDELLFQPACEISLQIEGPFANEVPAASDNLVLQAAKALSEHLPNKVQGAKIILTKNLPPASGIGGGSADAAATLRGLNRLWNIGLNHHQLAEIGANLGSDIPVCVLGSSGKYNHIQMSGRGEKLHPIKGDPPFDALLVNPGVLVPTSQVFAKFDQLLKPRETKGFYSKNDLTIAAIELQPIVAQVLGELNQFGAIKAQMCGSGATCFARFANRQSAVKATQLLQQKFPNWWLQIVKIGV